MSHPGPHAVADAERLVRSLTQQLAQGGATPSNRLSPVEERLLAIARFFFVDCVLSARANRIEASGRPIDCTPIDKATIANGARLALAAAVEIEAPLREIRERVEVRR